MNYSLPNSILTCLLIVMNVSLVFSSGIKDDELKIRERYQEIRFSKKNGTVHAKLKVYIEVSNQKSKAIDFYHTNYQDHFSYIEKLEVNGKRKDIVLSDVEQDGIFHNDLQQMIFRTTLRQGTKKLTYNKVFTDYKLLDIFYLHDLLYEANMSTIVVYIPDWLDLEIKQFNFEDYDIIVKEERLKNEKKIEFRLDPTDKPKRYENGPNRSQVYPHIMFIMNSFTERGQTKTLTPDLSALYSWYKQLVDNVENDNSNLKNLVNGLIEGKTTDLEKIQSIFYWVQDNIKYIAFEFGIMGFQPETCQAVLADKYGDCKGMSNLLKQMLNIAGYDARLCWLGTHDVSYDYDVPTVYADNHMICAVKFQDEFLFLDATEKYSKMGTYAHRIQGRDVLIEDGQTFVKSKIPSTSYDQNQYSCTINMSISGDQLVGNGVSEISGENVSFFLYLFEQFPDLDQEDIISYYITDNTKNASITYDQVENEYSRDSIIALAYEIVVKHRVVDIGEEIYFNPEIKTEYLNLNFEEERDQDYTFEEVGQYNYNYRIEIPEGFEISYVPDQFEISNDNYSFSLKIESSEGLITYNRSLAIKEPKLGVESLEQWNEDISRIKKSLSDQIIISKTK